MFKTQQNQRYYTHLVYMGEWPKKKAVSQRVLLKDWKKVSMKPFNLIW